MSPENFFRQAVRAATYSAFLFPAGSSIWTSKFWPIGQKSTRTPVSSFAVWGGST